MNAIASSAMANLVMGLAILAFGLYAFRTALQGWRWWPPHVMVTIGTPMVLYGVVIMHRSAIAWQLVPAWLAYDATASMALRWIAAAAMIRLVWLLATGRLLPDEVESTTASDTIE